MKSLFVFRNGARAWALATILLGCAEGFAGQDLDPSAALQPFVPGDPAPEPPAPVPNDNGPVQPPASVAPIPAPAPGPVEPIMDAGDNMQDPVPDASLPDLVIDKDAAAPDASPNPNPNPNPTPDSGSPSIPDAGGTAVAQCLSQAEAAGFTITACQMCLCQQDHCLADFGTVTADSVAADLAICQMTTGCTGACCVCDGPCSALGSDFGDGPCATEVQVAAGVTPQSGASGASNNGQAVTDNCMSSANNSCGHTVKLGECAATHCSAECTRNACGP